MKITTKIKHNIHNGKCFEVKHLVVAKNSFKLALQNFEKVSNKQAITNKYISAIHHKKKKK
jgi:hypothetical protein